VEIQNSRWSAAKRNSTFLHFSMGWRATSIGKAV